MTGFNVSFLPFFRVALEAMPMILVVFTAFFCTVTLTTCFLPLASVMVTFAFPAFSPFIVPLLVTVTIFLLLVVQDFTESPFARPLTFTFVVDCFTFSFILVAFTLMVGVSLLPTVRVSVLPLLLVRFCVSGANTVAPDTVVQGPNTSGTSVGVGVGGTGVGVAGTGVTVGVGDGVSVRCTTMV